MTPKEIRIIKARLEAAAGPCPMVNLKQIALAGIGIQPVSLWERFQSYADLPRPNTMKVGGAEMMLIDAAVDWCAKHIELWAAKQAARREAA